MKTKKLKVNKLRGAINRDAQSNRMAVLNAKAQAVGWTGVSEYLTAVLRGEVDIAAKVAPVPESWICKCGNSNPMRWETCGRCYAKRLGV